MTSVRLRLEELRQIDAISGFAKFAVRFNWDGSSIPPHVVCNKEIAGAKQFYM